MGEFAIIIEAKPNTLKYEPFLLALHEFPFTHGSQNGTSRAQCHPLSLHAAEI